VEGVVEEEWFDDFDAAGRLNVFRRPAALSSWKNKVFFCIIAPLND
jgi:hypothetical protein